MVDPVVKLTNADLTTGTVDGTGTFDKLMVAVNAHLLREFNANRITGEQYTKAYIAMVQSAMQTAVQYLLGRDPTYWQAIVSSEQMEVQRAQTMNTRSDGVTPVVGLIGKQKDLYAQQITSYQRDSEVKVAKLFTDAWITQKTIDEGLLPPDGFENGNLDVILAKLQQVNDLD